jgi:hypothetical protein
VRVATYAAVQMAVWRLELFGSNTCYVRLQLVPSTTGLQVPQWALFAVVSEVRQLMLFTCVLQAARAFSRVAAGVPVQQRVTASASACGAGMSWRKQSKSRWEGTTFDAY